MADQDLELEKPVKQDKVYPVTVVAREKKAVLVQWQGDDNKLHRVSISDNKLQPDNTVKANDLAKGILYGLDFSKAGFAPITAEQLIEALHNNGFWTADDVRSNPTGARNAVYIALQPFYKALFEFIKDK